MASKRMHRSAFLKLIKERLPELREAINEQQQILGFEFNQLTRCAQRAIHDGDRTCFATCVGLAEEAYLTGNKNLKALIDTMFVEDLEFVTPRYSHYWAWEMMPDTLKELYVRFWGMGKVPEKPRITWTPKRRK